MVYSNTAYRRVQQLTTHLCNSQQPLPVGDALKNQQQHEEEQLTAASLNSIELHRQQAQTDLSKLLVDDSVFVLKSKTNVTYDEWKSKVGQVIGSSEYIRVTQERIDSFAVTTVDPQWIHTRQAGNLGSPFSVPIAHGFLVLSLIPYLVAKSIPGIKGAKLGVNYGLDKVRFVSPVQVNSDIRAVVKLLEAKEVSSGGTGKGVQNKLQVTIEVKGRNKPAVQIEWLTRAYF